MTEDNAKKLICPFATRALPDKDGKVQGHSVACSTRNCMAWHDQGYVDSQRSGYCKLIDGPRR